MLRHRLDLLTPGAIRPATRATKHPHRKLLGLTSIAALLAITTTACTGNHPHCCDPCGGPGVKFRANGFYNPHDKDAAIRVCADRKCQTMVARKNEGSKGKIEFPDFIIPVRKGQRKIRELEVYLLHGESVVKVARAASALKLPPPGPCDEWITRALLVYDPTAHVIRLSRASDFEYGATSSTATPPP